jgi:hypothetical protein
MSHNRNLLLRLHPRSSDPPASPVFAVVDHHNHPPPPLVITCPPCGKPGSGRKCHRAVYDVGHHCRCAISCENITMRQCLARMAGSTTLSCLLVTIHRQYRCPGRPHPSWGWPLHPCPLGRHSPTAPMSPRHQQIQQHQLQSPLN